jgi:two-component system, chemotaxis family, protein-glutamate methylesterase/glutaminase
MMDRILRVLVVDDSAYVRKVIKQMLSRSPFIEVVGVAGTAEEALEMTRQVRPDVVTLDLIMPGIGGIGFIREQMSRTPIPILVVSIASESSELVLEALDAGAIDFVQKPSALASEKVFEMSDDLIEKVKAAGSVRLSALKPSAGTVRVGSRLGAARQPHSIQIVVIGISTGGPQGLKVLVPGFPADFPLPIAIVMHMPIGYTELYAKRLNEQASLAVVEAQEGTEVRRGTILIAPAGRHLTFNRKNSSIFAHLDARPFDTLHRPSVDVLFRSAADTFGAGVLGVVMTGMGDDGKDGSAWIKTKGGLIFAEAEESCVVYGMPRAVIEAGLAARVVPLNEMTEAIVGVAYGENPDRR